MWHLCKLIIFVLCGIFMATAANIGHVEKAAWYLPAISTLLGIGLYASTFGIDLKEARKHTRIIFSAITLGVFLKAIIIGGSLALISRNPYYLILGVAVAQIDPLSVSTLMQGARLSTRAKSILASWASFDDPITVIMSLYVPVIVAQISGWDITPLANIGASHGIVGYLGELSINLAYAAGVLLIWTLVRRFTSHIATTTWLTTFITGLVMSAALTVAIYYFWMLAVATMGLFLRPPINKIVDKAASVALAVATVLLGVLLVDGVNISMGIKLGIMAFGSQVVVGWLLTLRLNHRDRIHIAFAQQNGITAIVLGLLFEPIYPGTIAIIAPAIFTVNLIHAASNWLIDKHFTHN